MSNLQELRRRAGELRIKKRSKMKRAELEEAIAAAEKGAWYKENVTCQQCLREQRKQKIIDERVYNERTMANVIRRLVCDQCKHEDFVLDGDLQICVNCGTIKEDVNTEGDYNFNRVKRF